MAYVIKGNKIILPDGGPNGEDWEVCQADEPMEALRMLNKAHDLNDRQRKYTASARKFAAMELLPGFKWLNE